MQDQPLKLNNVHDEKLHPSALPQIPEKLYFTIGEVADLYALKPYVLRYWEKEFPQLKPVKRRGNRRYYQRQDVLMVYTIKSLLYEKGFTIEGARTHLARNNTAASEPAILSPDILCDMIATIENLLTELNGA